MEISKNDEILFTSSRDGKVTIWDLIYKYKRSSLTHSDAKITFMKVLRNQQHLLTVDMYRSIRVWDFRKKKIVWSKDYTNFSFQTIQLCPNEKSLFVYINSSSSNRSIERRFVKLCLFGLMKHKVYYSDKKYSLVVICPKFQNRDFVVCQSRHFKFYNSLSSKMTKNFRHGYNLGYYHSQSLILKGKTVGFYLDENFLIVNFHSKSLLWVFKLKQSFDVMKFSNNGKYLVMAYKHQKALLIKDIQFLGLTNKRNFGVQTDDLGNFTLEDMKHANQLIMKRHFLEDSGVKSEDKNQKKVSNGITKKMKTSDEEDGVFNGNSPGRDLLNKRESSELDENIQDEESGSNENLRKYWMGKNHDREFDETEFYGKQIKVKFIRIWIIT